MLNYSLIVLSCLLLVGCSSYEVKTERLQPIPLLRKQNAEINLNVNKKPTKELTVPKVLTLNHALLFALLKNPQLSIFSWEIKAAEASILQASLWPNPELSVEIEEFAGEDARQDFDAAEITIQFSQQIQLGGKISKQVKVAELERELAQWDYSQKRLEIFVITAKAFIEVLATQEKVKITKDLMELAKKIQNTVQLRVDSGKVSPIELTRSNVLVANSEIEWEKAKRQLKINKQHLSSLWGEWVPKFTKVSGNFYQTNAIPSLKNLEKLISQNPQLARIKKEREKRQAIADLEEAQKIPDITFDVGVSFFSETDDQALTAGFSLPIPIFNRNQGNILRARYKIEQAAKEKLSMELKIRSSLVNSYQVLSLSLMEIDKLKKQVLANSQSAFEAIQQGYQQGKFSYLDVLDAQRAFFETKNRYISALTLYHKEIVAIEGLIADKISESKIQGEQRDEK